MDIVILPAGVIDPDVVLAGLDPPIPYEQRDGQHVVPNGMGAAAQAALDAAADRRPAYRAAAKRALRQELGRRMESLLDSVRTQATVWDYLGLLDARLSGQTLSAAEQARQAEARGIVAQVRDLATRWRQAEAAVDGTTDPRALYDLAARPESWAGWNT